MVGKWPSWKDTRSVPRLALACTGTSYEVFSELFKAEHIWLASCSIQYGITSKILEEGPVTTPARWSEARFVLESQKYDPRHPNLFSLSPASNSHSSRWVQQSILDCAAGAFWKCRWRQQPVTSLLPILWCIRNWTQPVVFTLHNLRGMFLWTS